MPSILTSLSRLSCVRAARLIQHSCLALAASSLIACSSGGGGSGDDQEKPNSSSSNQSSTQSSMSSVSSAQSSSSSAIDISEISYQALQNQSVREGEMVELSLNVSGANSDKLTFNWSLDQDISFEGQNTDTIRFMAPEVQGNDQVQVSVEMDLSDGTLLGDNIESALITITDTDPTNFLSEGFDHSNWIEVQAFDNSSDDNTGVWRLRAYEKSEMNISGVDTVIQEKRQLHVYGLNANNQNNFLACGSSSAGDLNSFFEQQIQNLNQCTAGSMSTKYYQLDGNFRIEAYCDEQIVYAANLELIAGNIDAALGDIFYEDDSIISEDSSELCAIQNQTTLSYFDEMSNPQQFRNVTSNNLVVLSDQGDDYINYEFNLGSAFYPMQNSFDIAISNSPNNALIYTSLSTELNNTMVPSGTVTVDVSAEHAIDQNPSLYSLLTMQMNLELNDGDAVKGYIAIYFE